MTTTSPPDLKPGHSQNQRRPAPDRGPADATRKLPDGYFSHPTQDWPSGSHPYDDPTQGRKIGSDPYEDPTQGRKIGSDPFDDPTRGGTMSRGVAPG
jgi:hypothetical protein